jgi:hypothetical protein
MYNYLRSNLVPIWLNRYQSSAAAMLVKFQKNHEIRTNHCRNRLRWSITSEWEISYKIKNHSLKYQSHLHFWKGYAFLLFIEKWFTPSCATGLTYYERTVFSLFVTVHFYTVQQWTDTTPIKYFLQH